MNRSRPGGFTLIELVIVMAVVALLAAIALPSYSEHMARSRRADARATLSLAAQWMERFRAENRGVYTGAALAAEFAVSPASGAPAYDLALAGVTAATYRIDATPRVGGSMASDACGVLTLASDGQRTASGQTSGALFERCWR